MLLSKISDSDRSAIPEITFIINSTIQWTTNLCSTVIMSLYYTITEI